MPIVFDKNKMIEYYENLLNQHGDHYLSLDWKSPSSQKMRYDAFIDLFALGKKKKDISVLDLGCGFGDFYGYLKNEGWVEDKKIKYIGYDINPKLIEKAQKKYPEARFEVQDIMEKKAFPKFDYIFSSGIFNICFSQSNDHMEYVREMIIRMYDLSESGMASNFLSVNGAYLMDEKELKQKQYFYFRPEDLVNVSRFLTNRYLLRHDYHPGDFTLYLLK
jgi:SAM-dependent methyltransferase